MRTSSWRVHDLGQCGREYLRGPFKHISLVNRFEDKEVHTLSILSLVITTLEGLIPRGTLAPEDFSRTTAELVSVLFSQQNAGFLLPLSIWMIYFKRYTLITLPSRPLLLPRVIRTSSSLRIGIDRTLCFSLNSLLKGALIMTLRTLEGAPKCAFLDLRLDEWRLLLIFVILPVLSSCCRTEN